MFSGIPNHFSTDELSENCTEFNSTKSDRVCEKTQFMYADVTVTSVQIFFFDSRSLVKSCAKQQAISQVSGNTSGHLDSKPSPYHGVLYTSHASNKPLVIYTASLLSSVKDCTFCSTCFQGSLHCDFSHRALQIQPCYPMHCSLKGNPGCPPICLIFPTGAESCCTVFLQLTSSAQLSCSVRVCLSSGRLEKNPLLISYVYHTLRLLFCMPSPFRHSGQIHLSGALLTPTQMLWNHSILQVGLSHAIMPPWLGCLHTQYLGSFGSTYSCIHTEYWSTLSDLEAV